MTRGLWKWTNDRWPVVPVLRAIFIEDIPGGASYWYSFGSSVLFVFILQAVTGVCELFFYVPTVDHAYTSLSYLRTEVPFGWLIHNLHYWGATAMVVLVLIHVTRVFFWGAYKNPRQLTWVLGVCLFLLTLAMMFTGSPLPWDEKGYWATEVGTSIAGMTPWLGGWLKDLLQGGPVMGQLTLSRFFGLHVFLLSGLLGGFILIHLVSFRKAGSVGPWREAKRLRSGPFWPDQVQKDLVTACVVFIALLALAAFVPPAYTGPADPSDELYTPKPEWSFLFLYQALKLFPGSLEMAGAIGLPLVLVLLAFGVPFMDRKMERHPGRRPWALGLYFALLAAIIVLSVAGGASKMGVGPSQAQVSSPSPPAAKPAAPASGGTEAAGAALYQRLGCSACHAVNGKGGRVGPDLAKEKERSRSAEWLGQQIRDPRSHDPGSGMPAFGALKPAELEALAAYLLSLSPQEDLGAVAPPATATGPPATEARDKPRNAEASRFIGNRSHGRRQFELSCRSCHGEAGRGGVANPGSDDGTVPALAPIDRELYDADPEAFVLKIDPFLQHGSVPHGPGPALLMPDFGDSGTLTQQQIAHLEAYVLGLNGVVREKILRPGIPPARFFALAAAAFILAGLLAGAGWLAIGRRKRRGGPGP